MIAAADRAGEYVPRFCYHPRMSSVGMCRQCMVEVEGPRGPMMVVSCMTPVAEGQVVRTDTDQVKRAQEGMIELLLANHPLDCPVCDKGGECPLQDQAFSHGPGESRFIEEKRHYEKPIAISELVLLDRERCILCDRCTRFADEVAGDPLIHFISRGNNTQVQTFPDEPFSSYFSGNTVQICPVGALTAKPYRFKARPWDLDKSESTCTTCAVGCRITVESSRDELVRYQGVDSDPVNHGWLCDKGRFAFEAVKSEHRLEEPLIRTAQGLETTSWSAALATAAGLISRSISTNGPASVAVIGGARGTNEDAFAWARLAGALGVESTDAQLADGLPAAVFSYPQASIDEAASAATVLLLGPDLKDELPILYLRLRDAASKKRSALIEFVPRLSGLTDYAWKSVGVEPGRLPAAVESTLAESAVAQRLASGPVVVLVGRSNLAEGDVITMAALDRIMAAVPGAKVLPVLRRGNVRGAVQAGLSGSSTLDILQRAAAGSVKCLVLLGADPMSDVPDTSLARRALA
ncbi:MAG: molybdopterin-dependent oxidoreductase, partial [Actinomycetota bacterium]